MNQAVLPHSKARYLVSLLSVGITIGALTQPKLVVDRRTSQLTSIIQAVSACILYQKGEVMAAAATGVIPLGHLVEYLEIIPPEWQSTLKAALFFNPQIHRFLIPSCYYKPSLKVDLEAFLKTAAVGTAMILGKVVSVGMAWRFMWSFNPHSFRMSDPP